MTVSIREDIIRQKEMGIDDIPAGLRSAGIFYATKKHVRKYETSVVLFCLTTDQNRRDPEHLSQPTDRLARNLHVMSAIAISGGRPPIKTVFVP